MSRDLNHSTIIKGTAGGTLLCEHDPHDPREGHHVICMKHGTLDGLDYLQAEDIYEEHAECSGEDDEA